ncbi:MAG TPA: 4-hydroxy-3-methylbut-2-enyl diphosphate reductase [Azospirillaceae bacterium]|nr:4-hydroxy-3-methylbut-2-enyl diphosphate reductase [Azospirillaceae bacterium]
MTTPTSGQPSAAHPPAEGPLLVLLANPRGFCAGVERAIAAVEGAVDSSRRPVYVRHEIVHNRRVVDGLTAKGARTVQELDQVPDGAVVVFSAHGVPRSVETTAAARNLRTVDATCPLVRRVHVEGARHVRAGRELIVIGHRGHPEVEGTLGQVAPDGGGTVHVVGDVEEVADLNVHDPGRLAYVVQTTLSVDDTRVIIAALKTRFPAIVGPDTRTICYATQNRQAAVRMLAERADRIVVCGARNSSNSNRLREVAEACNRPALLVEEPSDLPRAFVEGIGILGVTAGASAPESLVRDTIGRIAAWRPVRVEETGAPETHARFAPVDLTALGDPRGQDGR